MKNSTFVSTFNKIEKVVPFNPAWRNGTGYYDHAVTADLGMKPGEIARSQDESPNNRKIILIATRFGNVVIFERYTPKSEDEQPENIPVVLNTPNTLRATGLVREGSISDEHFEELIGCYCGNIGRRVEMLFDADSDMQLGKVFKRMSCSNPQFLDTDMTKEQLMEHFEKEFRFCQSITAVYYRKDIDEKPVARVLRKNSREILITRSERGTIKVYDNESGTLEEVEMSPGTLVDFYNSIMITSTISL